MRAELLQRAAELTRREEPFVLAVVVRRQPPSSAQVGDSALVTAAGELHGWLGGSCTRPTVVTEARRALVDGRPRLVALVPDPESERRPGVTVFPMTCHSGGSVEIYLEPVLPIPRLVVFGPSPVARALVRLGEAMGYAVAVRNGEGDPASLLGVTDVAPAPDLPAEVTGLIALQAAPFVPFVPFVIVATLGEGDEEAIRAALALAPSYLGVVASSRRFAQIRETLAAQGVAAEALDAIHSPAGLALGAKTPEEIALSVLAQIVALRRAGAAAPAEPKREEAAAVAPVEAVDPVCGMTVAVAGAKHTAEHAGRVYYFCCGGCRAKFLAGPERYLTAAVAGGSA